MNLRYQVDFDLDQLVLLKIEQSLNDRLLLQYEVDSVLPVEKNNVGKRYTNIQ